MGVRILFDRRCCAAACRQRVCVANELNPTRSATQSDARQVFHQLLAIAEFVCRDVLGPDKSLQYWPWLRMRCSYRSGDVVHEQPQPVLGGH